MDDIDFTYLLSRLKQEGFDYCFRHYSSFKEIDDPIFHKLRLQYIEVANRLEEYIKEKSFDENYY